MIDGGILRYIIDTIEPLLSRSLISSDNYFYYLCLMGRYTRENCPDYITRNGYNNLAKRKGALDGIRLHTDTINDVVERIRPASVNHAIVMDHMDWFPPSGNEARDEIRALNKALARGGKVLLRSSSIEPWYLKVYEKEGFECKAAAIRRAGESIDRVNMYASTWVCIKSLAPAMNQTALPSSQHLALLSLKSQLRQLLNLGKRSWPDLLKVDTSIEKTVFLL